MKALGDDEIKGLHEDLDVSSGEAFPKPKEQPEENDQIDIEMKEERKNMAPSQGSNEAMHEID